MSSGLGSDLRKELLAIGKTQFEKEKAKYDEKLAVSTGKELAFLAELDKSLSKIFKGGVPSQLKISKPPKQKSVERVLSLFLSDTHYGSQLDPAECGFKYGPIEEARRTAQVVLNTSSYKTEHRNNTTLIFHLLGDLIQGQLHDLRDGAPLADQMAACIHIVSQAVRFLASNFPKVIIPVTEGNHGRNKARHNERAIFQKWDSNERVIYYALKKIVEYAKWENVKVIMGKTPYYRIDALGHSLFGTHGDTVLNPGNPHKTVNVGSLTNQLNKIMAAESANGLPKTSVAVVGHVHIATQIHLPGVTVFTNGSLIPPDNYALAAYGSMDSECGQWLLETTREYAVGDSRLIRVDHKTDKDSSLDQIISKYQGF